MSAGSRTVRLLRLRAPSEDAVRRAALQLEDALRTATLPDAGGRILLVRRLALGRIDPSAGPRSLAGAVERALARVRVEFRHGADAGAGRAQAVWFRDPLDAHAALARRLTAGPPPHEWFWPLAVPRWSGGGGRSPALRELAFSLAELPEAPAALPAWFARVAGSGHVDDLVAALREADVPPLARAAGIGPGDRPPRGTPAGSSAERSGAPGLTPPVREGRAVVRRFVERMLEAARPGEPGSPPIGRAASAHGRPTGRGWGEPVPPEGLPATPEGSSGATGPGARPAQADLPPAGPGAPEPAVHRSEADPEAPSPPTGTTGLPTPVPTAAGGLLLLLNALRHLGYHEWVAGEPGWAAQEVARRVLGRVMARLEVPSRDPAWTAVEVGPLPCRPPRRFSAPARWRDGLLSGSGPLRLVTAHGEPSEGRLRDPSGRLLLGGWRGTRPRALLADCRRAGTSRAPASGAVPSAESPRRPDRLDVEVVAAWEVAVRRWLRRYARLGFAEVVLRPGALAVTPTHLDVWLDLAGADLRIRRAGLDLDPGWLPWLGRVVAFHYEAREAE